jgi:hypothetical protein
MREVADLIPPLEEEKCVESKENRASPRVAAGVGDPRYNSGIFFLIIRRLAG